MGIIKDMKITILIWVSSYCTDTWMHLHILEVACRYLRTLTCTWSHLQILHYTYRYLHILSDIYTYSPILTYLFFYKCKCFYAVECGLNCGLDFHYQTLKDDTKNGSYNAHVFTEEAIRIINKQVLAATNKFFA